jgi:hypothetical protein
MTADHRQISDDGSVLGNGGYSNITAVGARS